MPRTPEEQKAWELQAYGMTAEELENEVTTSIMTPGMYVMSILSDCQEGLESMAPRLNSDPHLKARKEDIRQLLNKAKYLISHHLAED